MALELTQEDFMSMAQVRQLKTVARRGATEARKRGKTGPVRDWMIMHIALDAGLRVSEITALRTGDLLLEPGHGAIIVRNGKGGRERGVDIGRALQDHLQEYMKWKVTIGERTDPDAYLFPSPQGGQLTRQAVYLMFKRLACQAGLPERFSIHSCRHTYASMLYRSSRFNLRLVQKQLGHASIRTTQVYADVLSQDAWEAVNSLPQ
ncbi:MAG: site-specific integrase [Candidatus Bipolaricaulota bacterium]